MGEGAEDTLVLTGISSEDRKKYQAVMAKFDTFFRLLLFLRARIHKMLFYFYGVKLRLFSRKCSEVKKD